MPGDGKSRSGQQYDPKWNVVIRWVKRVLDYEGNDTLTTGSEGNAATEITDIDSAAAEATIYDTSAIGTALDAKVMSFPGRTSTSELDIPPLLTSIQVVYNIASGNGQALHPASQQYFVAFGASGSGSYNPRSTAQASAGVIPDLVFNYREIWSNKIPVTHYMLFMAEVYTEAELITRLNTITGQTVTAWPTFKPQAHTFTAMGMSVSIQQTADSRSYASFGGGVSGGYEYGSGYSTENGLTNKTIRLPPMLHAALTISNPAAYATAFADVEASTNTIQVIGENNITIPAVHNDPPPMSAIAGGTVTPIFLPATTPTTFPTSGLYLYDIQNDPFGYGRILVRASVVNATAFA